MRTKSEIGYFPRYGEEMNKAYATYASLYLDCCDDNLWHFHGREVDLLPIRDIDSDDESVLARAYMRHALDIAKVVIRNMSEEDAMRFLADYPFLPIDELTTCA